MLFIVVIFRVLFVLCDQMDMSENGTLRCFADLCTLEKSVDVSCLWLLDFFLSCRFCFYFCFLFCFLGGYCMTNTCPKTWPTPQGLCVCSCYILSTKILLAFINWDQNCV